MTPPSLRKLRSYGRPLLPYLRILNSGFFSQYGEDALLFIGSKPSRRGFYVDVGAYHPIDGSNTFKLYLRGWSGLTIEPNPRPERLFRTLRSRDTHLVCGVSIEPSQFDYFEFSIPMLNTMAADRAALLQSEGYKLVRQRQISSYPLKDLLTRHAADRQIDLLSIDCEGFDLEAASSIDWSTTRPTVVIIEDFDAFNKLKSDEGVSEISNLLRKHDYTPVIQAYYSSLYVARDWRELNARTGAYNVKAIQPGIFP